MRRLGMNRILRYFLLYGLIFLAIMGIFSSLNNTNPKDKDIDLHRIRHLAFEEGKVKEFTLQPDQLVYVVRGEMEAIRKMKKAKCS